jgi:hypothetical protein
MIRNASTGLKDIEDIFEITYPIYNVLQQRSKDVEPE